MNTVLGEASTAIAKATRGGVTVSIYAEADLPTRFGVFKIIVFRSDLDDLEHVALVHGDVSGKHDVPTRVHSECLTGDVFGSLRCDCRAQLEYTLESMPQSECGIVLYMRQEGRGIGLGNKIRAYALQQGMGMDTVEANLHLGFDDDLRDYRIAALMLNVLGVGSVRLLTNNPKKVEGLEGCGIRVSAREPLIVGMSEHNASYLATKAQKSGHLLPTP